MKRIKRRATDFDSCQIRVYPLGDALWIGRVMKGGEQVGVTPTALTPEEVVIAAIEQGTEPDMVIEHRHEPTASRREGDAFCIGRVHLALQGRTGAAELSADERAVFDAVLGEFMDGTHTAEARDCWATFSTMTNTDQEATDNHEFRHLLSKARDAARGGNNAWSVQSTGEKLAVALVLNRFDWLQAMDYTIAEAIKRVGQEWVGMIPTVAKVIHDETEQ